MRITFGTNTSYKWWAWYPVIIDNDDDSATLVWLDWVIKHKSPAGTYFREAK